MKKCGGCNQEMPESDFSVARYQPKNCCIGCFRKKGRARSAERYLRLKEEINQQKRARYSEHKRLVLSVYGNICKCCGETEEMFLTVDHVENDGYLHRKRVDGSSHNNIYSWLVRKNYPSGFQILCMNCNTGKHRNNGICPHKSTT